PQLSELGAAAKPVVESLKEYQQFLENDLLPRAKGDWRLGKEKFARKLELELDAGLTADQVLREAEAEATRVEGEMYVIARQLWSGGAPKGPLPREAPEGRRHTIQQVFARLNQDHGQVENLVPDVRATVARVKQFIAAQDILRLPDPDRCRVVEMPEF